MPSPMDWQTSVKDASYKWGQATKTMSAVERHLALMKDCLDSGHEPGAFAIKDLECLMDDMELKYQAAVKFFSDLLEMKPEKTMEDKLTNDLAKMEEQRATIRGTTVEVTCEPLLAALPPPPSSPLAGAATLKVQSSLKPSRLSAEATTSEFRVWSRAFGHYFAASNMDSIPINQQRGFLESCLEAKLVRSLQEEVEETCNILGTSDSCMAALEELIKGGACTWSTGKS